MRFANIGLGLEAVKNIADQKKKENILHCVISVGGFFGRVIEHYIYFLPT